MENKRSMPIGIELVRMGVVTEREIDIAINYQKTHPNKKIGDILYILKLAEPNRLLNGIAEILGERAILLTEDKIKIDILEYVSLDVAQNNRAIPFEISGNKIKVCFADGANQRAIDTIKLLMLIYLLWVMLDKNFYATNI